MYLCFWRQNTHRANHIKKATKIAFLPSIKLFLEIFSDYSHEMSESDSDQALTMNSSKYNRDDEGMDFDLQNASKDEAWNSTYPIRLKDHPPAVTAEDSHYPGKANFP